MSDPRGSSREEVVAGLIVLCIYLILAAGSMRLVYHTTCNRGADRQAFSIMAGLFWPVIMPLYLPTLILPCETTRPPENRSEG